MGKRRSIFSCLVVICLTVIVIGCAVLSAIILLSSEQTVPGTSLLSTILTDVVATPFQPTSNLNVTTLSDTITPAAIQPGSSSTQVDQLSLPLVIVKQENNSARSTLPTTSAITLPPLFQLYPCLPKNPIQIAEVIHIIDGDTIRVSIGGQEFPLRYIGIDAPENTEKVEAFGQQAFKRNQQLLQAKIVFLVKDVSEMDRYQRLLRYVFVGEDFINLILVKEGFARAKRYPPDTACNSQFQQAQVIAQTNLLGIWGIAKTPSTNNQANSQSNATQCDPAYPTVCIPSPPPDINCVDITYRSFKVLPPDPHHFDGDKNGIGCESK